MHNLHAVSSFVQAFAHFFGDHYRAVLAARASEADREVALAFVNIVRQKINQQIGDAQNELLRLRKGPDVLGHARMTSRKLPKFRHEMRVGEKANVEHQIRFLWHTVAKTKAHARDQNTFSRRLLAEGLGNMSAQLVHVELRSIDDNVRQGTNGRQVAPLSFDRSIDRRVRLKRRSSTASEASRKATLVGIVRRTAFRIPGRRSNLEPSRTSTTRAVRRISADCNAISAKRGINSTGRLSTQ